MRYTLMIYIVALGMVFAGCAMLSPPVALIVTGSLIWLDLMIPWKNKDEVKK